jgi:phosphatidylglycerol:prolipoprotein diacylglycerol transferase
VKQSRVQTLHGCDHHPITGAYRIPTQLLSAAGDFLIFLILTLLSNFATRYFQPPSMSGMYLILYGIGRFAIEFLRADPRKTALGLTSNQFVSIAFVLFGIALIVYSVKRAKKRA